MGNSITSINTIIRVNFLEIFEQINGVEEILKKDPVDVYSKMDYKTRSYYRQEIEKIAKKTKISEMYIAKKFGDHIVLVSYSSTNNSTEGVCDNYLIDIMKSIKKK